MRNLRATLGAKTRILSHLGAKSRDWAAKQVELALLLGSIVLKDLSDLRWSYKYRLLCPVLKSGAGHRTTGPFRLPANDAPLVQMIRSISATPTHQNDRLREIRWNLKIS